MATSLPVFHEKFNFPDGNLLVSATGSRDGLPSSPIETLHFRLHQSILTVYSSTFADMLSMPQGKTGRSESPVVHLQDPLHHIIQLFTAVYYGGTLPLQALSKAKWQFLTPVLVLADKYDMAALGVSLLPYLLQDWPTNLEKWDEVRAQTRSIVLATAKEKEKKKSLPGPDDVLPDAAMAIKFGQVHSAARNVLPAAFLHLSSLSHSNGLGLFDFFYGPEEFRSAEYELLSSNDWLRVLRGQCDMRDWLKGKAESARSVLPSCSRLKYMDTEWDEPDVEEPDPCSSYDFWNKTISRRLLEIGGRRSLDVLGGLKEIHTMIVEVSKLEQEMCSKCGELYIQVLENWRDAFWRYVPRFFQLHGDYPNWGQS